LPAKDRHHEVVKRALVKEGWIIDDEQVPLTIAARNLWIDIQASKTDPTLIILVEVKELAEVDSAVEALANAVGKMELYRLVLLHEGLDVPLYLAVSVQSYNGILSEQIGQLLLAHTQIPLIVFDPHEEVITQWIP
jgi:hypothetical protein